MVYICYASFELQRLKLVKFEDENDLLWELDIFHKDSFADSHYILLPYFENSVNDRLYANGFLVFVNLKKYFSCKMKAEGFYEKKKMCTTFNIKAEPRLLENL